MSISQLNHKETSESEASLIVKNQATFFRSGETLPYRFRREQLKTLKAAIVEREQAIYDALYQDFRKSPFETYATEIAIVLSELDLILGKLERWMEPEKVSASLLNFPSKDAIYNEPYGLNLIFVPWNYPFQLSMNPLLGAISAGNCAVIKPSELAPHISAVIAEIIEACFDPKYVAVVEGGIPTAQALLAQKWGHIFFTGSVKVGKIVARAAAENLTPLTLELGGKTPCIVDETADIDLAARRIVWGKFINAGQTCVAPDYILAQESIKESLLQKMAEVIQQFYGDDPQQSPDYPRIINERNFRRLQSFLQEGKIVAGGQVDESELYIAPTLLDDVNWKDSLMKSEIFGPILPVLGFKKLEEVISILKDQPKPLALYFFSNKSRRQKQVLTETSAGGVCINDVVSHYVNPNLPFGGVGQSGHGAYHGRYSFDAFSHRKSVSHKGNWLDVPLRYPPYKGKLAWVKRAFLIGG